MSFVLFCSSKRTLSYVSIARSKSTTSECVQLVECAKQHVFLSFANLLRGRRIYAIASFLDKILQSLFQKWRESFSRNTFSFASFSFITNFHFFFVSAEYILQCHRSDPKLLECLKGSLHHLRPYLAQGIPEIEVFWMLFRLFIFLCFVRARTRSFHTCLVRSSAYSFSISLFEYRRVFFLSYSFSIIFIYQPHMFLFF